MSAYGVAMWLLAHAAQLLGTVAATLLALYFWWHRAIAAAAKHQLDVKVTRGPERGERDSGADGGALHWLELDAAEARACGCELLSLGQYMASLQVQGTVSLQKALVSVMQRHGPRVALPLALFAPPAWRAESGLAAAAFAGTPYASLALVSTISTLDLLAASATAQRYSLGAQRRKAAEAAARVEAQWAGALAVAAVDDAKGGADGGAPGSPRQGAPSALQLMILGSNPQKDGGLAARCPNPFRLPGDLPAATGVPPEALRARSGPVMAPDPAPIHPLFPDLASGSGGLFLAADAGQAAQNSALAMLCNKLAANALIGAVGGAAAPQQRFEVVVAGSTVSSVEGLAEALEGSGHSVRMAITSNITSFGVGLCCVDDGEPAGAGDGSDAFGDAHGGSSALDSSGSGSGGSQPPSGERDAAAVVGEPRSWAHIPLAYPLATGLFAQDSAGNDIDVMTLMVHAAVQLDISGPLVQARLEWCLSIEGYTGWLPKNGVERPWQQDPAAMPRHAGAALASPAGRRAALRLMTASAAALNAAATRHALMFGGYGFLGVCIDSVAAVQQALTGGTTLYPLILGGDAKMSLLQQYHQMQVAAKGRWEYEPEAAALRDALLALPCDAVVEPAAAAATAARALASLPERSVFAGVKRCREALQAAARLAQTLAPAAAPPLRQPTDEDTEES